MLTSAHHDNVYSAGKQSSHGVELGLKRDVNVCWPVSRRCIKQCALPVSYNLASRPCI